MSRSFSEMSDFADEQQSASKRSAGTGSTSSSETVLRLLAEKSTSTELFGLESISPVRSWDYSLPTLTRSGRFTERKPWNEDCHFTEAILKCCPILQHVSLDNLALVGGAVTCYTLRGLIPADFDFFVIADEEGLDDKALENFGRKRAEKFIIELYQHMTDKNAELKALEAKTRLTQPSFTLEDSLVFDMNAFKVERRHNVFTILLEVPPSNLQLDSYDRRSKQHVRIQISCKAFRSLAHRLQETDIDATAAAYYQGRVLFSEIAKFSIENVAVIVDVTRMTSVDRLVTYFDRGFDIIVPHFDISKVRTWNFKFGLNEVIDLPRMNVFISSVDGNKLNTTDLQPTSNTVSSAGVDEVEMPDSEFADYCRANRKRQRRSYDDWNVGSKIHHNILQLINNRLDAFIYYGQSTLYRDAFAAKPFLTERMIVNSYETVRKNLLNGNALNFDCLKNGYFTCYTPPQIAQKLLGDYLQRAAASSDASNKASVFFGAPLDSHIEKVLDDLVRDQVVHTKQLVRELDALVAAYQPPAKQTVVPSVESWYGSYYRAL
jgi:hypothetical protein